jgi:hypothetical protein
MGFNFSWVFVDGIKREDLLAALDLGLTGEAADPHDLGTHDIPLAVASFGVWQGVFAHYSMVLDTTIGTDPPRLLRLPSASRVVSCVVLEHAMVSYASLWSAGRHLWEINHRTHMRDALVVSGELPSSFADIKLAAEEKQREENEQRQRRKPGEFPSPWGVDYIFDVPINTASAITGFRHDRGDLGPPLKDVQHLQPINGNNLRKLANPPKWWQLTGSTKYD